MGNQAFLMLGPGQLRDPVSAPKQCNLDKGRYVSQTMLRLIPRDYMFEALGLCMPALSAHLRLHLPWNPIDITALILNMVSNSAVLSKHIAMNMERTQFGTTRWVLG